MNAVRWSDDEYRAFLRRQAVQLPLGRGVTGLDKPRRINTSAPEWREAELLTQWRDGEGGETYPEVRRLYHVPNGGYRHKAVAGKMKAQGVLAGVLDWNLDVPRGPWHSIRIELKRRSGGTVSPAQQAWIEWHLRQGNFAIVCRGWEQARDRLIEYLTLEETDAN